MEAISLRRGLPPENVDALLQWANSGGPAFLRQFAGPKWRYPLAREQLDAESGTIYSIFAGGSFAGILQCFPGDGVDVHIGRFLVDPSRTGRGVGEAALRLFCREIFRERSVGSVSLNVYMDNARALRLYEKCGFRAVQAHPEWNNCRMALSREDFAGTTAEPPPRTPGNGGEAHDV